ncbi:hypothetical protein ASC95_27295 [Pelomonas sp. Root1217]|uniref:hypothetical protein n=1 Tax=Pelomonas sp. Root1217 TaxID=1736430 RepID=UPI0007099868|nr:hypothetical protein [Pelomonas sp. Root1217]KQV46307.1 hypothetical protein ASC95_27295 [Pelomonas sp. Root1217]
MNFIAIGRLVTVVAMCLLVHCAWSAEDAVSSGIEAHYFNTGDGNVKKVGNPRFNFWFDIPASWRAFDRSANGDGYFLDVGIAGVDVRTYGSWMDFDLDQSQNKTPFKFADGKLGWRLTKETSVTYVRPEGDHFLYLYVRAPAAWVKSNEEAIINVARSLRPGSMSATSS